MLIAGGCCDIIGNLLSSTELYDPATNSFAAPGDTAVMNTERYDAVAIMLPPNPNRQVTLLPPTLDLGTVKIFQSSEAQTVTLTNGDGKLSIRGWSIGPDFKVAESTCPSPTGILRRGQSCDFAIIFQPQSVGTKNELFRVFDDARNGPRNVALHGVATRR